MSETKRKNVNVKDFILAFKQAKANGQTNKDVAGTLGMKLTSLISRASSLRKKGVNVPHLSSQGKGAQKLNVDELNSLLQD